MSLAASPQQTRSNRIGIILLGLIAGGAGWCTDYPRAVSPGCQSPFAATTSYGAVECGPGGLHLLARRQGASGATRRDASTVDGAGLVGVVAGGGRRTADSRP